MSMDFDSATLPTQHEDEEYDKEDYEREQELHQLLMTGLPDDMLEDSRDISSPELNYSGCSVNSREEQIWEQKGDWNDQYANNSPTDKVSYSAENPVPNGETRHFITNEVTERHKVKYNPYPVVCPPGGLFKTDENQGSDNEFEQMQSKFLESEEDSTEAHRFVQLQTLYNARGRELERMQHKQVEYTCEIRHLNHQLAMTKGVKEGIAISCQELRKLLQDAKEREVQLEGQIKALECRIEDLSGNEEEALKKQKIAEAAMESMQQQLRELSRSESLTRAREQHENIIGALKEKHEESILALQKKLDATSSSLEEQKEKSKRLAEQVEQLHREQEETKVKKADIINGLTKSLEASQQQCRDLLQTGSMQEITQLRIQLQQVQSARNISDNTNKALQEELADLKEQIALYESAAKFSTIIEDVPEDAEIPLSDSYMGLCIKNENLKMSRLQSSCVMQPGDSVKTLCKNEAIRELKAELGRSLSNIRTKRHQVAQLQNEAKEGQSQIAELKELLQNAESLARNHEIRATSLEKQLETKGSASEKALRGEVEQLRCEIQVLHKEIEDKQQEVRKLTSSEKQFKEANQELYNEMRQMIQEFDQDKQEAIDRCERIHRQHHEDSKCRLIQEQKEQHELEKTQMTQFYQKQITQLTTQLEQLNQEMSGVQECYIAICKEKDSLENQLREEISSKLTTEQKLKHTFLAELQQNLNELHEKHEVAMEDAKQQWIREKESEIKLQVESQLELAKAQWHEEQQKVKEQALSAVETEWQLRLHKAVEQKKQDISQMKESIDRECHVCQELETRLAHLKMTMEQKANEEKVVAVDKALQQYEVELQRKHEDNVAKQMATIVKENEEKWKDCVLKEIEKAGSNVKTTELQEKIHILECKIELQKEEASALAKTEMARVQAQWKKEKQEEINRIHELNENDYRAFLDEHRNKLNEVLKATKEDFIRQRNDLLAQKDAELNLRIQEKQKEWAAHQEEQIKREKHQYESALVAEIENYMRQISKYFVKRSESSLFRIEKQFNPIKPVHAQINEVCAKLVEEIIDIVRKENKLDLQNALRETEKQHKEYKTEVQAQLRKLELSELQLRQERDHLQNKLNTMTQQKEMKCDQVTGKQNVNPEEQCNSSAKKFQQECQQLKKRLEKMSWQLQLTVHEHRINVLHLKEEHERTIKIMQNEKYDLLKRLKENESLSNKTNPCSQENWCSKTSPKLISTKGLEEIRHQYLRAVDKIREDMMRYIQESKVRAAEMIRAEVFRERQQTARKMRKYYLTCLHQLLADGGKNEGAEKRIMSAAGKLAAMAKAIETPLPKRKHDKPETHTVKAQLTKKISEPAPNVSENTGRTPAFTQANQNENSCNSEDRIRKSQKYTAGSVMPQRANKSLFDAATGNGASDEELSITSEQDDFHKRKSKSGFKAATSMSGGAVSKSKYQTTGAGHCQDSAMYLSQMSVNKARVFSSVDDQESTAPLQVTQKSVPPSKEFVHLQMAGDQNSFPSSKRICCEASDMQITLDRDEDNFVVNLEAADSFKMDSFNFRHAEAFHLDDYSVPIKHSKSSGVSLLRSSTDLQHQTVSAPCDTAQVCPSCFSAASDISTCLDENTCFLKKTTPDLPRLHSEQVQDVTVTVLATNNRDHSHTRTGRSCPTKDCIQKKHPPFMFQNIGNIQQDSGFDSPFLNFS